jgi:predicted phosphodiesterase
MRLVFPASVLLFLVSAGWAAESQSGDPPAEQFRLSVDPKQGEFTLIVVPDTQRYAAYFPEIFLKQFEWIRDSLESLNVKYVIHLGDLVEEGHEDEWRVVDQAFSMLDGLVPYLVVPGNHDLDRAAAKQGLRATTRFNAVFSPKRFAGRSWYGGSYGVTGDNSFGYFEAADREFLVLGLEYGPSDESLEWADSLASNHEQRVILVTHCYMYEDDTRLGEGDKWNPHKVNESWNDGEQIWQKLVAGRDNIVMVLSGHVKGDGTGLLVSENNEGGPVVQMLSNYQFLSHGGQGFLRILKFNPADDTLEVYTYSPWLDQWRDEEDQRFSLPVPGILGEESAPTP